MRDTALAYQPLGLRPAERSWMHFQIPHELDENASCAHGEHRAKYRVALEAEENLEAPHHFLYQHAFDACFRKTPQRILQNRIVGIYDRVFPLHTDDDGADLGAVQDVRRSDLQ